MRLTGGLHVQTQIRRQLWSFTALALFAVTTNGACGGGSGGPVSVDTYCADVCALFKSCGSPTCPPCSGLVGTKTSIPESVDACVRQFTSANLQTPTCEGGLAANGMLYACEDCAPGGPDAGAGCPPGDS